MVAFAMLREQPKTITFTHRSPSFVIRSHQSSFPYTSNLTISYIFRQAEKLLRVAIGSAAAANDKADLGGSGAINGETEIGPYGNIQLSFSGLERLEEGQKGIAGFFSARGPAANASSGPTSSTKRSFRAGEDDAEPPSLLNQKRRKIDIEPTSAPPSPPPAAEDIKKAPSEKEARRPLLPTYTCERCARTLEIPASSLPALVAASYSRQAIEAALDKVRDEERDYHLARDLAEDERKRAGWRTTSSSTTTKKGGGAKQGSTKTKVKTKKSATSSSSSSAASTKAAPKERKKEEGQTSLGSFFKR